MVKISILCSISSIFWILRDIGWSYIYFNIKSDEYFLSMKIEETFAAIIDTLCLYLSFNFSIKCYNILCCPFHKLLYQCCIHYTFNDKKIIIISSSQSKQQSNNNDIIHPLQSHKMMKKQ